MVPGAGVEPARMFSPRDFKSLVSTNFTTWARWRCGSESNRSRWICNPLHNRFVIVPFGAGNEDRTRDSNLGKVMLYQLSYSRNLVNADNYT